MPAHGDQHKLNGATTANPFEEVKPHISEYTAQEIATLQSRLNKRLGPEYISTRPGPGNQKIAYLPAEKAINLANEVFGFNGWSSSIQNIQIDFVDENTQSGKVSLGLSVVLRVTLKDGTYHEDIGYGGIDNCKGKAMAFEKSKKEATTDALKRALRNFGNVLGNCMYDKEYIAKVSKVKSGNGRFDVNELHRHPDFAPKVNEDVKPAALPTQPTSKTPTLEFEDSFDVSEFDDIEFNENDLIHPDEVIMPGDSDISNRPPGMRSNVSNINTPSKPPQVRPQAAVSNVQSIGQYTGGPNNMMPVPPSRSSIPQGRTPQATGTDFERSDERQHSSPDISSDHFSFQQGVSTGGLPTGASMGPPAGFYSARATKDIDPSNIPALPNNTARFNPHAVSPSIRKTAGVDHTKSVPVRREVQKIEANKSPNIMDPRGDLNRRVGLPGQPAPGPIGRPGMSTSAYRPPTRSGSPALSTVGPPMNSADRGSTAAKRPPLNDVSNLQHNVTAMTTDGADAKRQRVGPGSAAPDMPETTTKPDGIAGA